MSRPYYLRPAPVPLARHTRVPNWIKLGRALMRAAALLIVMAMCGAAWFLIFAVWAPVILVNIR